MSEWQPIETAPQDGTEIWVRRIYDGRVIYEGPAVWRTVDFPPYVDRYGTLPGETMTHWMAPARINDKRVPVPTEWRP